MFSGKPAVISHLPNEIPGGQKKSSDLEIFFPEFFKAAKPCLLPQKLQIPASKQQIVIIIRLLFSFRTDPPVLFCPNQDFPVGQIDEFCGNLPLFCLPQGHKLRRAVQKGIVAFVIFFFFAQQPLCILIKIIQCHRSLCIRMCQNGCLVLGILWSLHQNAVWFILPDCPLQMIGTDRAVMADRNIHNRKPWIIQIYFRYFLAS